MNPLSFIKSIFSPPAPDPRRFANAIEYVPNFHGELIGRKKGSNVNDRVRVDEAGHVEFMDGADAYAGLEITSSLTERDIHGLRGKNLDPNNPNYAKAKVYFAKYPACSKEDLAKASGVGDGTAKDVLAVFRKNL